MANILIEVLGSDAIAATEELLAMPEITGSWETEGEAERKGILVTIATIIGIIGGTMAIQLRTLLQSIGS